MTDSDDLTTPMWRLSEVDIFRDLDEEDMGVIAAAAPRKTFSAGELLYSTAQPSEVLFILKHGRVRIFRVSVDGRALTCAIVSPGTIFGEMVLLGQRMYDNSAEALEDVTVCVMSRADVHRLLLSDVRVSARITELLGQRLTEIEQRLSDSVFKTAPQRVATTLLTLAAENRQRRRRLLKPPNPRLSLTHQQLAALAGTSRETTTKVLHAYAERGLIRIARGSITVLDTARLTDEAG